MFDHGHSFFDAIFIVALVCDNSYYIITLLCCGAAFSGSSVHLSGGAMRIFGRSLLGLCCILALSACGARKTNVVKSSEPEGQRVKASQKPYTVLGQRYEPLRSHEGFVQTGVASWYGKDFHGKKTSNGETYDMHAMTAAHKTLPLGVYVKVRNRENGREATVRVNDRGPFVKGRILDLSYAAAKALGVDMVGTAPVRIEALGYRQDGSSGKELYKAPATYDTGNYTVQVGAFKEQANAVRLSGEMRRLHGFSDVRMTNVNGEVYYRVYAGKYSSLNAAEDAEKDFSEHGYPGSFTVALE
jgi:rare lipoprotein A